MICENSILNRSFEFAIKNVESYGQMIAQKEFVLSKQVLPSGTSIGADLEEASAGISQKISMQNVNCIKRSKGNTLLVKITAIY